MSKIPPLTITGYIGTANVFGASKDVRFDPDLGGLLIKCSHEESKYVLSKCASSDATTDTFIAMLQSQPAQVQDIVLTRIVNEVTGDRAPTAAAGRLRGCSCFEVADAKDLDCPLHGEPKEPEADPCAVSEERSTLPVLTEEQQERAAIMEFDGGSTREEAESTAHNNAAGGATGTRIADPSSELPPQRSTSKQVGMDPAGARAKFDSHDPAEALQAYEDAQEEDDTPLVEPVAKPHRDVIQVAAKKAVADNPAPQTKLVYEPEPGQHIRQAPQAGTQFDPAVATPNPAGPQVYEVGPRKPAQPNPMSEFFADATPATTIVPAKDDLTPAFPPELLSSKTLRPVFTYLYAQGHTDPKSLAAAAYEFKDDIAIVARTSRLEERAETWLKRVRESA